VRAMTQYFSSTIGSKQLMGLTGLGLCLFLLLHMAGNVLILVGPEAFNMYGHKIITNPLLYIAEVGLVAIFLVHVFKAAVVTLLNKSARPQKYAVRSNREKKTSLASRTLGFQGIIILVFIILHLATFKYGAHYTTSYNGVEVRDLYRLVLEVFRKPGYVIWYTIALIILSLHLGHGFYSCFQSLGLNHPKYTPALKTMGYLYDFAVTAGFIILPVYVYFLHQ
jgi:succinate dehydrogenase / fumarate reductase cytochrome b subunit